MFCKQCGKPIDDGQELCEDCAKNANAQQAEEILDGIAEQMKEE